MCFQSISTEIIQTTTIYLGDKCWNFQSSRVDLLFPKHNKLIQWTLETEIYGYVFNLTGTELGQTAHQQAVHTTGSHCTTGNM